MKPRKIKKDCAVKLTAQSFFSVSFYCLRADGQISFSLAALENENWLKAFSHALMCAWDSTSGQNTSYAHVGETCASWPPGLRIWNRPRCPTASRCTATIGGVTASSKSKQAYSLRQSSGDIPENQSFISPTYSAAPEVLFHRLYKHPFF